MNVKQERGSVTTEPGYFSTNPGKGNVARNHYFTHAFPPYASVRMRLLSMAFDLVLVALLVLAGLALVMGDMPILDEETPLLSDLILLVACVPLLYFVGFWCLSGSSPGKMLLSLRVVDAETLGEPSGLQCLLRYVGYVANVFSFGLGVVGIFDNRKPMGWHDRLSGTIIIQQ